MNGIFLSSVSKIDRPIQSVKPILTVQASLPSMTPFPLTMTQKQQDQPWG
jgi:hypothetical protein